MTHDCSASVYTSCDLCPRRCGVDRTGGQRGYCRADDRMRIGRAALHYWEEPCISGTCGSGTVFFSGCNLGCVFCQNYKISHTKELLPPGKTVGTEELVEIFFRLKDDGAHNINLVTPDIYLPSVAEAISIAKKQNLGLPFVWNSSSYINAEHLSRLDGLIDIYLPDFKFFSSEKAKKYSNTADYPKVAAAAIAEMVRQCGECVFSAEDDVTETICDTGALDTDTKATESPEHIPLMQRGVIIRHLLMPGGLLEAKMILRDLWNAYGDRVYFSLMHQYTPLLPQVSDYPELQNIVSDREYDELVSYALRLGISRAYIQEGGTASESFIPEFL